VATALEVSAPGQLRDEQVGTYRELEQKVGIARGLANKLRARHLEAYDQQGGPVAYADTSGIWKRLMMARVRLDEKLAACLPPDHAERSTRMLLESRRKARRSPALRRRVHRGRGMTPKEHGRGSRET
jgi:hypothetical protein